MSSIKDIIGPEHRKLFAFELGKIAELDFVYTLVSTNINQSVRNFVKINMTIRSGMTSRMDLIGPELFEISVLELEKNAIFDFVYNPASANIDQSVSNLVIIYMTNRSRISLIMAIIGPVHLE